MFSLDKRSSLSATHMPACLTNALLEKVRTCFSLENDCEEIVSARATALKQTLRSTGPEPQLIALLHLDVPSRIFAGGNKDSNQSRLKKSRSSRYTRNVFSLCQLTADTRGVKEPKNQYPKSVRCAPRSKDFPIAWQYVAGVCSYCQ